MLLRNESRVKHSIEIKLVFDDNTTKEIEINEGNCVDVSYRRNGCLKKGIGIIREIKPYVKKFRCPNGVTAAIVLDMSENNNAHVEVIELDDIIDISIVYPCCQAPDINKPSKPHCNCCSDNCQCNKEEEQPKEPECVCKPPVHYSCLVGTAITDRGVLAHG